MVTSALEKIGMLMFRIALTGTIFQIEGINFGTSKILRFVLKLPKFVAAAITAQLFIFDDTGTVVYTSSAGLADNREHDVIVPDLTTNAAKIYMLQLVLSGAIGGSVRQYAYITFYDHDVVDIEVELSHVKAIFNVAAKGVLKAVTLAISNLVLTATQFSVYYLRVPLLVQAGNVTPTVQTVPLNKWAAYAVDVDSSDLSKDTTPATANATTGYDSEALAIAGIPAVAATHVRTAIFTVKTAVGLDWIGGTDAFKGGAGGNPALETNLYPVAILVI